MIIKKVNYFWNGNKSVVKPIKNSNFWSVIVTYSNGVKKCDHFTDYRSACTFGMLAIGLD